VEDERVRGAVRGEQRRDVAATDAPRAERGGDPADPVEELAVPVGLTGGGVDDGDALGILRGELAEQELGQPDGRHGDVGVGTPEDHGAPRW
jgi:hypothetical protein